MYRMILETVFNISWRITSRGQVEAKTPCSSTPVRNILTMIRAGPEWSTALVRDSDDGSELMLLTPAHMCHKDTDTLLGHL